MRHHVELSLWEQAERGREALEATPEDSRTRADYTRVMDEFRAVYHTNPADIHAPDSVNAVAELLAEQGRKLHDQKYLKDAIGQYEFLRTQYPGSSLRVPALLAEAQIYENDLHNKKAARATYALFLKKYPGSELAEEARAGLDSLNQERGAGEDGSGNSKRTGSNPSVALSPTHRNVDTSASAGSFAPMPTTGAADRVEPAPSANASGDTAAALDSAGVPSQAVPMHVANARARRHGQLALVTGIRHWSTPTYTRVAIDLGDDVTYEAARVPNPDRIYFDLHGTKLAPGLAGKSFAVTDDGFLKRIRAAQFSNDMTRVVLDVNDVTEYSAFLLPNPYRLIIDIHGGKPGSGESGAQNTEVAANGSAPAPAAAVVTQPTASRPVPNTVAEKTANAADVADLSALPGRVDATAQPTSQPISAVVKESANSTKNADRRLRHRKVETPGTPARAAIPTADGETSLVRALGLKIGRIVIDAGHGGHDSGTLGVGGIEEKDIVLDVALRLGKLLHDRLGAEIIYTRSDDTFIPLETRTAIANKAQADLFISIHANSSSDPDARGVETYYLNFTTQPDALEVAARENAVSDQSIHQLSDLVKKITLKDKIDESREFAADVQQSLYDGLRKGNAGLKNRGVKKAPFVVLIGANMPSILAEISFVTNPEDAEKLQEPAYRERVAESLYRGVAKYESGLSGTRIKMERASAN
ncbi:hypothetical protein GCM10011507_20330 [Edaphobacter acidisoli]|uniref:N-acetylmuramoyl-L-alanine amidase n=1 Tax=Edaphobacter acidisoli TaxID=2040573 RepID=A0A916RTW6_9BACT|nr:N-acetylmuramoyl-L-alanine amidase [Edaphobacter acidisoli]GGA68809.1 hypothetical protein GCM10011507_20330 [Edaphobacter acidisoli]